MFQTIFKYVYNTHQQYLYIANMANEVDMTLLLLRNLTELNLFIIFNVNLPNLSSSVHVHRKRTRSGSHIGY